MQVGGDRTQPPSIEVARVVQAWPEEREAVVQLRGWLSIADPLVTIRRVQMWRLRVADGAVVEARLNGLSQPLVRVPGLVRDLARTLALDATVGRPSGWWSSPVRRG